MSFSTESVSSPHHLIQVIENESSTLRFDTAVDADLEALARRLAIALPISRKSARGGLLTRVRANHGQLLATYRQLSAAVAAGEQPSPDAEWLLDNFYVIDEVFREVLTDLPQGYYNELPIVASGPFAGLPRTYALAVGLIAHCDSSLEESGLKRYVLAYQEHDPLTIGEVWAIPIMLRAGLLENLDRLARQMGQNRSEWAKADRLIAPGVTLPLPEAPSDTFVAGVLHGLRDQQEVKPEVAERVHDWLARLRIDPAELLRREHQRQAANQVSIGNAVTSLRLLSVLEWADFFEDVSHVERELRAEPTGVYLRQTFATRDSYRAAVERFARGAKLDETIVARSVVEVAAEGATERQRHLGHYLIGEGRGDFARRIGYRPRVRDRLREWIKTHPEVVYFGLLLLFTLGGIAGVVALAEPGHWVMGITAVLIALFPASELAVALVNFVVCRLVPPHVLPRMNFREGVPDEFATFVVIPGMLTRPESARVLLERLEMHYLANPDPNLYFALLSDYADAPGEHQPNDDECLRAAMEGVALLNEKHSRSEHPLFFVFHRKRLHNPTEGCWMGWERKRGKLHEFNRLIRGATDTTYVYASADVTSVPRTRFVLTLDSDTVLPRDTARLLVGILAHPLNAPVVGPDGRRVIAGYSILQPRVSFLYKTGWRSLFARIYAYSAGVDPYSSAVSATYEDLFERGTFTGKGLYDVDAFEMTAGKAFPENHVLSHDLIESNFALCALVNNVEVFDDFPARYSAFSRREHRWARGDWQLLPWLAPRVPTSHDGWKPNPLPTLERWKILDNLRRTLVPAGLVLMLVLGWLLMPGAAWYWSAFAVLVLSAPLLLHVVGIILSLPGVGIPQAWVNSRAGFTSTIGQALLSISFLPHQALSMLDAIGRTLWRLFVSRKRLLEWETAAAAEARYRGTLMEFLTSMWPAVALALGLLALLAWRAPVALSAASPFLVAWMISPLVAWVVSQPLPVRAVAVEESDRPALRRLACKIWGFFETFISETDNWLPPDNYQEGPVEAIAHRTSPTNVGLLLTSTLAAHDLGYVTLLQLADRLAHTLSTFDRLERFKGHFLNWYDTRTLKPLPPAYVSTVDSGNLLTCLLVLEQGLLEKLHEPFLSSAAVAALSDRLHLLRESADRSSDGSPGVARGRKPPTSNSILEGLEAIAKLLDTVPTNLTEWSVLLGRLGEAAERWRNATVGGSAEMKLRAEGFADAVTARRTELEALHGQKTVPASLLELAADGEEASELVRRFKELAALARRYADEMDFRFLYNPQRNLFAIGYHVPRESLDQAHYDLLASEACLTSLLTVARGAAPRRHWFQLGRTFIRVAGQSGLMSWGGTMFEYLMPRLFLPVPEGTLLDGAWNAAVARQIEYGRQTGKPWGISESGYNLTDAQGNYQYQAFGVPGLGLKRGLARDLVIAPYATVMAVPVAPREAIRNLRRLASEGAEGIHGPYEAVDYTPERLRPGQDRQVVYSYMAHHQGMGLLALTNALLGDVMPARLAREPAVRAVELLLQERVPLDAPVVKSREDEQTGPQATGGTGDAVSRRLTNPSPREPRTQLLSNGNYSVMLTSSGAGYSTRGNLDVTRWRADPTIEECGHFVFVRDLVSGKVWSSTYQPMRQVADYYEVIYSIDKVEYRTRHGDVETHTEVAVSPQDDAEVRRVVVVNHSNEPRVVELTSYAEVVLTPHGADLAHPAFHKLFLETSWLPAPRALVCRRRPRAADQRPTYAVHILAVDEHLLADDVEYETSRADFLGRRGSLTAPAALSGPLSKTVGPVLDPAFSLRCRLRVPAGGRAVACFTTGVVESEEHVSFLAGRFHTLGGVAHAFELAWAHSRVELKHFNLSMRQAQLYQRLAGHVLFPPSSLRATSEIQRSNRQGQSGLWRHGISGDLPIVLVRLPEGRESIELFRKVLTAHSYWNSKGLRCDLVVLNEAPTSYHDNVANELTSLIRAGENRDRMDRPSGVFLRKADQFSPDDVVLLLSWARIVLDPRRGSLEDQIGLPTSSSESPPPFKAIAPPRGSGPHQPALPEGLRFFNGIGGFSANGREYVIAPGTVPPMPWVNVVANPAFGFLVSDSGSGYAWAGNSQLNRLTPWNNDPVSDPPGEVVYLRDERTGEVWSPTPLPAGGPTLVRHGTGYTAFEQRRGDVGTEMTVFAPPYDAVKLTRLRLTNHGGEHHQLTVTYYAEWVLGTHRDAMSVHVHTEYDERVGAVIACNPANPAATFEKAFATIRPFPRTWTTDRAEFLGRNGSLSAPAALGRTKLSGRTGAGHDPCMALQTSIELPPGSTVEVVCLLGVSAEDAVVQLVERLSTSDGAAWALGESIGIWDKMVGTIQVSTPDEGLNVLMNRWLLYQVVSSRLWGRTGFYQSGGAYGFRDQLQDVMALVNAAPGAAREQILRAASRQFREGDVQHWWHPPSGQGVRTRFSDDFLWLVLVACHYAEATGDSGIFDEQVSFLEAPLLEEHQEEVYAQPRVSAESASLYEHCLRALQHGWKLGDHGLPLMGIGDWNDGMNKVGAGGKGESVWLAWFQSVCLERFAAVAGARGDEERVRICRARRTQLIEAGEAAWDGAWFRRAYFDDGTPLGSSENDECRIDSIAQSWAVLTGADSHLSEQAVSEADRQLVREEDGIILLFDPPFDDGPLQPGYVKGYVPGTRENGGQYTHAAIWLTMAMARLGRGDRAGELLRLLEPVRHSDSPEKVAIYRVEPYVVAADVYGRPPHVGRGGWTWYTGSASWLYQVALSEVLGFRRRGNALLIDPCIPRNWKNFTITYRHGESVYEVIVENPNGVERGVISRTLDDRPVENASIELLDDGTPHRVVIRMS